MTAPARTGPEKSAVQKTDGLAVLALIAGACCIALAPIMVKVSEVGPQASAAWRLILAMPLLLVWSWREQSAAGKSGKPRGQVPLLALAGLWFGLDLVSWHAGIVRTSAANATFLANLAPVFLVAWAWITTRERPQVQLIVTLAAALLGALLMSGGAPGTNPEAVTGDLLSALTAVWYALYLLTVAKLRNRFGPGRIMADSTAVAAAVALLAVHLSGERFWPPMTLAGWAPLVVLGLVSHVGGQGLLAWALGRVTPTIAGIIILVQPVVAGFIGWVWLGEALGPLQLLGGALVLAAVWQARQLRS